MSASLWMIIVAETGGGDFCICSRTDDTGSANAEAQIINERRLFSHRRHCPDGYREH